MEATEQIKKGKKIFLFLSAGILCAQVNFSQTTVYDNFEGNSVVSYGQRNGILDSAAKNPASGKLNSSATCAKYTRSADKKFDNIKMNLHGKLSGVSSYATYVGIPPKLKLKIYTTAPVGTLVEILLGSKGRNNEYPAGTHSQYQAHTKVSGEWEELEFLFSQIPEGSETAETEINQVTLMFAPNSANTDTYYFDDLTGPVVEKIEIADEDKKNNTQKKGGNNPKQPDKNRNKKPGTKPNNTAGTK